MKGEKAGTAEVFAENLPGIPDNIRRSKSGGYWVGMALVRHPDRPKFYEFAAERPWLRRLLTKVIYKLAFLSSFEINILH